MANCNSTTTPADVPSLTSRLGGICTRGSDLVHLAGLLEMCGASVYQEAIAIRRLCCPEGLTASTEELAGHISFLADTIRRLGEEIEEAGNAANDIAEAIGKGGAQ